jgi:hypothetical protein
MAKDYLRKAAENEEQLKALRTELGGVQEAETALACEAEL